MFQIIHLTFRNFVYIQVLIMWYFTCINATLHVKRLLLTVSCEVFTMNFERETELVDVSNNSFESSIDFVQTVCFDADDYDNGLFLDSLVDHDAAAINGPIIQNGEINDIINPTNFRFCAQSISVSSTSA